jgi:predicted PhzF superfamily epimerase YddE/YHI9
MKSVNFFKEELDRIFQPSYEMEESDGPTVGALGNMVGTAGAQKIGDIISKMDPNAFMVFVKHIDKEGLDTLFKSMNGEQVQPEQPEDLADLNQEQTPTEPQVPSAPQEQPEQPQQELGDLLK